MSRRFIRIAAGLVGLAVAALPQVAAAQSVYDAPHPYRPYAREDFRFDDRSGFEAPPEASADRRVEGEEGLRRHGFDRRTPEEDRGADERYADGPPDHWDRYGRTQRSPFEAGGYRPAAVELRIRPAYGALRPVDPDVGCTLQRSVRETYAGIRETITRDCHIR